MNDLACSPKKDRTLGERPAFLLAVSNQFFLFKGLSGKFGSAFFFSVSPESFFSGVKPMKK